MTEGKHTGRRLAVGALLAGAAGYVAGILTAPKSGKQTRKELADKADDVRNQALAELKKLQSELNELLKTARDKSLALGSAARTEFNEAVIRAKDARNKAAHVLKAARAGESDDPQLNKAIKQVKQAKKNLAKYLKK